MSVDLDIWLNQLRGNICGMYTIYNNFPVARRQPSDGELAELRATAQLRVERLAPMYEESRSLAQMFLRTHVNAEFEFDVSRERRRYIEALTAEAVDEGSRHLGHPRPVIQVPYPAASIYVDMSGNRYNLQAVHEPQHQELQQLPFNPLPPGPVPIFLQQQPQTANGGANPGQGNGLAAAALAAPANGRRRRDTGFFA